MIRLRVNTNKGNRLPDRRSFRNAPLPQRRGAVGQLLDVGILQRVDRRLDAVRDAQILHRVDDPFHIIFDQMDPSLTVGECRRQGIRL